MAVRKFLYVDSNADYLESTGAYETADLNSNANGLGASLIGIEDATGVYTGTTVEAALDEIASAIELDGFDFTENNVLADNDLIYPALEKLDLRWGDLGSTANGEGASIVGIEDVGGFFTSTDVEGALQELASITGGEDYVEYTVGAGGVTKGDVLFVSSADTASTYSNISSAANAIGIAASTEAAAGTVRSLANDEVVTGVLTAATPGDKIYWNGSALTATQPSGSGQYVVQAGIAKNATDLHVEVRPIKRNS